MTQSFNLDVTENMNIDGNEIEVLQLNGYNIWEKILEDNSLLVSLLNGTIENVTPDMLPEITFLGTYAFAECTSLKSFTLPETISSMNSGTLYGCTNLKELNLPNNLTTIPANMCYNCTSLNNVNLPNSLTTIEQSAFRNSGLTEITLPETIGSLGNNAFAYCSNLKTLTILKSDSVLSLPYDANETQEQGVFYKTNLEQIRVPKSLLATYRGISTWKYYEDILVGF